MKHAVAEAPQGVHYQMQRCTHFVPGLRSMPWWDASAFPSAAVLERNYLAIRDEFFNLLCCGQLRLHPQSKGGPRRQIADGNWNLFELCSNGWINAENAVLAPRTICILTGLPEARKHPSGLAYFSVIDPRVHIDAHCGPTNSRIRLHLGLRVPKGASMRVGDETRPWKEGLCTVFDDSWEHEVFNPSDFLRAVLLLDLWHPDLTARQRSALTLRPAGGQKRVRERSGWLKSSEDETGFASLSLRSQVGTEHLRSMVASMVRLQDPRSRICGQLATFLSESPDGLRTGIVSRSICSAPDACSGFWNWLAQIAAEIPANSTSDLINLIHVACAYWRSWSGNESLMHEFMDTFTAQSRTQVADTLRHCGNAQSLLRWCAKQGEQCMPFASLACLAVIALRDLPYEVPAAGKTIKPRRPLHRASKAYGASPRARS